MRRRRLIIAILGCLPFAGLILLLALGGGDEPPVVDPPAATRATGIPEPASHRRGRTGAATGWAESPAAPGGFAGRLLLPADVPPGRLEVVVRGEPAFGSPAARTPATAEDAPEFEPLPIEAAAVPDSTGGFALAGLSPGAATVLVRIPGEEDPVFAADGVVVTADGTTLDPRIATIDLRAVLRAIAIAVEDSAGQPVADAVVTRSGSADAQADSLRTDLNGRCLLVTALAAVELELRHRDHRPARARGVAGAGVLAVRLRPKLRVRIELAAAVDPASGFERLAAKLVPAGAEVAAARREFDADGATILEVDAAGRYRVEIEATKVRAGSPEPEVLTIRPEPDEIEVRDSPDPMRWVVTLTENRSR